MSNRQRRRDRRGHSSAQVLRAAFVLVVSGVLGVVVATGIAAAVPIGVLAFLAAVACSARRLDALLLGLVLALFLPSTTFASRAASFLTLRWILGGAVLFALAVRVSRSSPRHGALRRVPSPLLALTALGILSTAWSVEPALTLGRAVSFLAMVLILAFLNGVPDGPRQFRTALTAFGALLAIGGLSSLRLGSISGSRYAGLFINPNALGAAAAVLFPLAFHNALSATRTARRWGYGAIAALLAAETAAAASRGGLLAVTGAYLYLAWSHFRAITSVRRLLLILLPAVLSVVASVAVIDPHRFSGVNSRGLLWATFPEVFARRAVLGHGFGATDVVLRPLSSKAGYLEGTAAQFHNSYLTLLSDVGLVAGVLFFVLLLRTARRSRNADPAMIAIVIAGLISAAFESWLLSVGSGFSLVFWFALVEVNRSSGQSRREPRSHAPLRHGHGDRSRSLARVPFPQR